MRAHHSILAAALASLAASEAGAQQYSIREVLPVSGDGPTYAWDVNNNGVTMAVCELADGSGTQTVFYDSAGVIAVMSSIDGTGLPYVWAGALNDTETFVGTEVAPNFPFGTIRRAFVSGLPYLPDRFPLFVHVGPGGGTDISNSTHPYSVGQTGTGETLGGYMIMHAFAVKTDGLNNPITDLGTLGGPFSRAEAINTARRVVGVSLSSAGPLRAFLWRPGQPMIDLGTLGGPVSWARDINADDIVVGWSQLADGAARAFRWQAGTMTPLGTLGGEYAEANGINAAGQIVGMSLDANGRPRAARFDADGAIDLNSLIPSGSGWTLQYAQAINDSGAIVGWGRHDGRTRGFILTSCPADFNSDGWVNGVDFDAFAQVFLDGDSTADFNRDGFVNGDDFEGYYAAFAAGC